MPVVKAKPTSPGRRFVVKVVHPDLHKGDPFKALVQAKPRVADEITRAESRRVILVVATNRSTESLILNAIRRMALKRWSSALNTIRIEPQILRFEVRRW